MKIQEEFQKFEDEQVGLPEAGRVGAVAEKGKELQRRLDVLNRRELVIELKLQNRNTTISTLMSAKKQDFEASVRDYNTRFSQALQLYNAFDRKETEIQRNSQASLDVLIDAFTGQIQGNQATLEDVMAAHGAKLEELELQAGLPKGSKRELLKSKSASKGFVYKGTIGSANTGYKALWINPDTGESKLESLTRGTGGDTSTNTATSNILAQGLSATIITSTGKMKESSKDKVLNAGVPIEAVSAIWDYLTAGVSLDQIRQDLKEQLTEAPNNLSESEAREQAFGWLDDFMGALQKDEGTSGGDIVKRLEDIINKAE